MSDAQKNDTQRTCDLLAAYEMDLLEAEQRGDFESHLEDCDDCLDELYAMAPLAQELKSDPAPYARAAGQALVAAAPSLWQRARALLAPGGRLTYLVPAVLTAALAVAVLWPEADKSSRWSGLAEIEPLPWVQIEIRAGGDEAEALFEVGMTAYQQGDYATAAADLGAAAIHEQLPRDSIEGQQATLYLGVSLLLAGDATGAVPYLQAAGASPLRPVADRGAWYLAQAYLLTDQTAAARETLDLLLASPVYGSRAAAQLSKLKP